VHPALRQLPRGASLSIGFDSRFPNPFVPWELFVQVSPVIGRFAERLGAVSR